jgi:hypothetical protein
VSEKFINPLPGVPAVESPFFKQIFADPGIDAATLDVARQLHDKGFAVIDFPDDDFDQIADNIKAKLHEKYDWQYWQDRGYDVGDGLRIQDAWKFDPDVRRLAVNAKVIELLSKLFGRQAWPFQTLNFPVGTQQPMHSDSAHFSSVPERFMCGVWVALEDIDAAAGPLLYYPGSHKWPIYTNEHIGVCSANLDKKPDQTLYEPLWKALVEAHGVQPETFVAKKGQALIWLPNLLHGGNKQADKQKTRWSQVTHYYFDGCAYYTPMWSDPFYGNIVFRELPNIVTGEVVKNTFAGNEIAVQRVGASYMERPAAPQRSEREILMSAIKSPARWLLRRAGLR